MAKARSGRAIGDRRQDEMYLAWLRMVDAGVPYREIGRRHGRAGNSVHKAVATIRRDYAASEAGE